MVNLVRIATRGSPLALVQTRTVIKKLKLAFPSFNFEELIVKTTGDLKQETKEAANLDKKAWIDALEQAIVDGAAHIAIHSAKDLPAELKKGTGVSSVLNRETPNDLFIGRVANGTRLRFSELKNGAKIGTSSQRRKAQLLFARSDLTIVDHRGNVQTRIDKLDENDLDGIILAAAGVSRLGIDPKNFEELALEMFIPAPCQGILAAQFLEDDKLAKSLITAICNKTTEFAFQAERAFSAALEGGCQSASGAYAEVNSENVTLYGVVLSTDGKKRITKQGCLPLTKLTERATLLANEILEEGGRELLNKDSIY